jgi:branched-chain amino acid transport system ATP-binding protein
MSADPLLAVEDVYTAYGLSQVLFGVSLRLAAGECVALLGRNGVGKSTTMRSIMGLTPPTRGRVLWKGRDIRGRAPYQVAQLGIGFVPEDRRIFSELTVWENLDVAMRRAGPGGFTFERVYDLFPKLRELRDRQGGFLSGGEQQMLTIARTLMGNPELLLLDEPSEGLAPLIVDHLREQVAVAAGVPRILDFIELAERVVDLMGRSQLLLQNRISCDILIIVSLAGSLSAHHRQVDVRLLERNVQCVFRYIRNPPAIGTDVDLGVLSPQKHRLARKLCDRPTRYWDTVKPVVPSWIAGPIHNPSAVGTDCKVNEDEIRTVKPDCRAARNRDTIEFAVIGLLLLNTIDRTRTIRADGEAL